LTAKPDNMTYLWSNGASSQSITVTPAETTTYSVTVTSPEGCEGEVSQEVTVKPLPIADAGDDQTIAYDAQATLTAADAGEGAQYHWEPAELIDAEIKKLTEEAAKRAMDGITNTYLTTEEGDMHLDGICLVSGLGGKQNRDGSFAYYMSEPIVKDDAKGVGPFLLAYTEQLRLA